MTKRIKTLLYGCAIGLLLGGICALVRLQFVHALISAIFAGTIGVVLIYAEKEDKHGEM